MKKSIIALVAVLALGVGTFVVLNLNQSKKTYHFEDLLPTQPSFYIRSKNLTQRLDNLTRTKLFQDLKSIDYNKASAAFGAQLDAVEQIKGALNKAFSDDNQKIFKALFGNDVALAIYAEGLKTVNVSDVQDVMSNVFIITRISPEIAAVETVSKFLGLFNKDLKVEVEKYNGKDINLLKSADGKFVIGYVRFNNIVVMGIGQKAARAAIDVDAKKQKALAADDDYLKRSKLFFLDASTFGYLSIKTFYPLLMDEIAQITKTEKENAVYKEQLKQIQGLEVLIFSSRPGEAVSIKADLLFNPNLLSPDAKAYYVCKSQENESAKFVPADALTYQWNSCFDFSMIWKQYKKQLALQWETVGQDIDVDKMIGMYEQKIGVSIDGDVLPVFGKEFGLYLTDVDLSGIIPLPKLVFFVDTTGQAGADALINKLLALQPNLQFEEMKYHDNMIRYISIPSVDGLALSVTYVGNTLLLATNLDVLKSSLDAYKDPARSIISNVSLKSTEGLKNSVFFIQVDRLLQKGQAIADWVSQTAKQNQVQHQAFLAGSQKKLEDLRTRNEQLKADIAAKEAKVNQMAAASLLDTVPDSVVQSEVLKKEIDASQKELTANQEKEKNLDEQITFYETKALKQPDNEAVINDFVKPFLKALENIKYFTVTTVNEENVLSSTMQLKIE